MKKLHAWEVRRTGMGLKCTGHMPPLWGSRIFPHLFSASGYRLSPV
jgi:hypothetical protein